MKLKKKNIAISLLMLANVAATAQEVGYAGSTILAQQDFGLTTNQRSWGAESRVFKEKKTTRHTEDYTMRTGKRSHCVNRYSETTYAMVNAQSDTLRIIMREYSDGYAFRYALRTRDGEEIVKEGTQYHVPAEANRWMQLYKHVNTGYENYFPLCKGGVSPEDANITTWGYPALVEMAPGRFVMIADSYNFRYNCGSILENSKEDRNTYTVKYFGTDKPTDGQWLSAWHVMMTGSLADIVESTLVTDVADPCSYDASWVEPGLSSWIYWAYNHGSQEYDILKEYVDLAVDMQWPYTLVDAEWDVMRGGTIEELCRYSVGKGVKPMMWYNSTTNWVGKWAPTPQGLLNDAANCDKEFAKIASWGVKGVKIDFFKADNWESSQYYYQLLDIARKHQLLVNFHGGTIPHGWQRTYPNVITCEGVLGAEWYNNNGTLTNKAACHNATLPFTRNVIGPMDYTPGTFTDSQYPHVTNHTHELALPILFESGIQHMPDRPSAYKEMPAEVKELLSTLPTAWDDTRFVAGYPGESAVIARRKGNVWYVAGINGKNEAMKIRVPMHFLKTGKHEALFVTDGGEQRAFAVIKRQVSKGDCFEVDCTKQSGFVIRIQ